MWDSSTVSHDLYSLKLCFAQTLRAIESSRLKIKAFRDPDFVPPLYTTQQSLSLTWEQTPEMNSRALSPDLP